MTTAVCLARQGRRVAVFEQHYTAGGYTHAYRRRGWEWDVGIHYVGQLAEREPVRVLSDYLTGGALRWAPLGDPFDEYRLAGEVYRAPVGFAAYQAGLIARFPAERASIEALFGLVRRCRAVLPVLALGRLSGPVVRRLARALRAAAVPPEAMRPAREVVEGLVRDERLRQAVLTQSALLLADSTARLPFFLLAVLFEHFRTGAWYPVGGSAAIARAMLGPVRAAAARSSCGHRSPGSSWTGPARRAWCWRTGPGYGRRRWSARQVPRTPSARCCRTGPATTPATAAVTATTATGWPACGAGSPSWCSSSGWTGTRRNSGCRGTT
ncbi:phytoene desaturase family protein [Kitasatospora arboriphila]